MDIREFAPKQLPYHFVLFYGMDDTNLLMYKQIFGGKVYDNALLTYCYIDSMAGISYDVICCAYLNLDDGTITYHRPSVIKTAMRLREGSLECNAAIVDEDPNVQQFASIAEEIKKGYGYYADKVAVNPDIPFDEFRHPKYPNDFLVSFFDDYGREERMWVRETSRVNGIVRDSLLDEPYNELLGLNAGDEVEIEAFRDPRKGRGSILPIWRR